MSNAYEFVIRLRDEASAAMRKVGTGLDSMHDKLMRTEASWGDLGGQMIVFNQAAQAIQGATQALEGLTRPGEAFQSSLADLTAITGLAEGQVKELGRSARQLAKEFGTDAARGVESYKLILSQLGPELAKSPEVLDRMASSAHHLSKTMRGDTVAATQVLTTALNQFQVDLANPIRAAAEMERMMNAMAAAAKEGSAELPAIQMALQQAGLAAKTANVSFEEANAAIQVLDRAGRKGAEGGTALRNVLSIISQGRFLPEKVKRELEAAGISVDHLGNESLTLAERLRPLEGVMGDAALMSNLFGRENYASAVALISNIGAMEDLTGKITGTNTAFEQSAVIMNTHAERMNRVRAFMNDLGVSAFNLTKGMLPVVGVMGHLTTTATQLLPALALARTAFIKAYQGVAKMKVGLLAATKAKLALTAAFLASPLGIALAAVTALAGAFLLLRRRTDDATMAQKALNSIQRTAEQNTVAQRVEVQRLSGVMRDNNTTIDQKRAAYNRLVEIAPEYFGKLTFEQAQTESLIDVQKRYIEELIRTARVKAKEEKLVELYGQLEALGGEAKLTSWQTAEFVGERLLTRGVGGLINVSKRIEERAAENQRKEMSAVNAQIDALEAGLRQTAYETQGVQNAEVVTPGGTPGGVPGAAGDGQTEAEREIGRGVSAITGGGARATNININMGSLVETFTVHAGSARESATEIHDLVVDALLRSVNSANAVAASH